MSIVKSYGRTAGCASDSGWNFAQLSVARMQLNGDLRDLKAVVRKEQHAEESRGIIPAELRALWLIIDTGMTRFARYGTREAPERGKLGKSAKFSTLWHA